MKRYSGFSFVLLLTVITLTMSLLLPASGYCQTDPKGSYSGPPGSDAILYYFRHIEGHEGYVNSVKVSKDADLDVDLSIFRYVHYGQIFGDYIWTFNLLVPFGSMHLEQASKNLNQTSTGFGDPTALFGIYTPRPGPNGFQAYLAEYITFPLGDYHNTQAVNMGNNRFAFKTEASAAYKPIENLTLELATNIEFYTKNDDYLGGRDLEKDPLYGIWGHITYDLTKSIFISGSYFWFKGGETEVNGVKSNNETETHSAMFTTGILLTPNTQLLLQYYHDLDVENGTGQDAIRLRLAYFF